MSLSISTMALSKHLTKSLLRVSLCLRITYKRIGPRLTNWHLESRLTIRCAKMTTAWVTTTYCQIWRMSSTTTTSRTMASRKRLRTRKPRIRPVEWSYPNDSKERCSLRKLDARKDQCRCVVSSSTTISIRSWGAQQVSKTQSLAKSIATWWTTVFSTIWNSN